MYAPTAESTAPADPAFRDRGRFLTSAQAVEHLAGLGIDVTERRVRGWIKRGVLAGTNPERGIWLVTEHAIEAWLENGQPRVTPLAAPRGRRLADPAQIDATAGRRRPSRRAARATDLQLN